MKPKHQGGYTSQHTQLCERTLVTLMRGLGPWKQGIVVTGGLVPRYLIPAAPTIDAHVGTTDVGLVLNLTLLGEVEAYRRLEQNLKNLGFERGKNDEGAPQHFSWRKPLGEDITIVVDLLCDASVEEGGRVHPIEGERRLSALGIPGAYLVMDDFIENMTRKPHLAKRGSPLVRERRAGPSRSCVGGDEWSSATGLFSQMRGRYPLSVQEQCRHRLP